MYHKSEQSWIKHGDFIFLDILCMNLAFAISYFICNGLNIQLSVRSILELAVVLTMLDLLVLIVGQTMHNVLRRGYYREFVKTVKHVLLVELLFICYLYFILTSYSGSRLILVYFGLLYCLFSYVVRVAWKFFLSRKTKRPRTALYIISTCDRVEEVVTRYQNKTMGDYLLTGVCVLDLDQTGEQVLGIPVTTSRENLLSFLCREWVDEVVVSVSWEQGYPSELVDSLAEMGIVVHIEMDRVSGLGWKQEVEKIAGCTVLTLGMSMASPLQIILKRLLDIAGGLVGCFITLLLTLFLGPLIYMKSPGPIFFTQTRVGKNGKLFKMYKFRSMYLDAEERKAELAAQNRLGNGGLMFKLDYDPRIIGCEKRPDGTIKKGIGNFIRDWSLDEFPQFLNVLKGDLSLVGTRPPTVDEWERYELHHRARLAIKPGITGMWQVSGRSQITDFEQVVELDKKYIQEWSFGLDIKILFRTFSAVLKREGSM